MKYIVVGSAPYVVDWWTKHGKWFKDNEYRIIALNNAWNLPGMKPDDWYTSSDFYINGTCLPTHNDMRRLNPMKILTRFLQHPYWYSMDSGTMLFNAIYDIINRTVAAKEKAELIIIGCDMQYSSTRNHWYGKGTADPLRFGEEALNHQLNELKKLSDSLDFIEIRNASDRPTRLPFEKFTSHLN